MISTLPTSEWFGVASPLVALFLGGALVLLSGTLALVRRRGWVPAASGMVFLGISLVLIFLLKPYIYTQQLPMDQMFVYDAYARHFQLLFLGLAAFALAAAAGARAKSDHPAVRVALVLFLCTGLTVLAVAADLLTLYVAGELVFVVYALFAAARTEGSEAPAGMTAFLRRGAAISFMLLLGTALLCGLEGSTDLWEIAGTLQFVYFGGSDSPETALRIPFTIALLLFFAGWLARLESFPFQGWMAAAHQRYGPAWSVILSTGMKAGALAAVMRVLWILFTRHSREYAHEFPLVALISVLALLTMAAGTWKAWRAGSLRVCMAWSGTVHVGLMMLGVAMMDRPGMEAVLVYLPVLAVMTGGLFLVLAGCGDQGESPLQGLARRSRAAAAAVTIFLLSLVGVPLTAGFTAKYMLFGALLGREQLWFKVMAGAGILASVLSAWYYGKIIHALWFKPLPRGRGPGVPALHLAAAALLAALVLAAGLYWPPLRQAATAAMMIIEYQY
jgi:NADH-quinone oxidoreductase subunit N